MSTEREEPGRLAEEIPDEQVSRALAKGREGLRPGNAGAWPPAWFASAPGDGSSVGARSEELLAEGFGLCK